MYDKQRLTIYHLYDTNMPTAVKQTLDPKLLTSKGLDASNFQSKEVKKEPVKAGSLLSYLEQTGQIKTPWTQSVIKPVQEVMKPMSQELPAPTSNTFSNGQPILASMITPWGTKKSNFVSKSEMKKILDNAPSWVDKWKLLIWLVQKWKIIEWYNDPQSQITQAPQRVEPQISYGETPSKWINQNIENPLWRAWLAVAGWVAWLAKWLYKWVTEWWKDLIQDTKAILKDPTKDVAEKFNKVFLWEFIADFVWGDLVWWTLGGWVDGIYRWFTTAGERRSIGAGTKKVFESVVNKLPVEQITKEFNKLPESEKKELMDLWEYTLGLTEFIGMWVAKKPIKKWLEQWLKQWVKWLDNVVTSKIVQSTAWWLKWVGTKASNLIWPEKANKMLTNMNRITKWEQEKFKVMAGETVWEFLNNRWIVEWWDEAVSKIANKFIESKTKADKWLEAIKWEFKDKYLSLMANEAADFAENTLSPDASKMRTLAQKADDTWLSMAESNILKRFYESNNKFTYWRDITAWEKTVRATNIDNAVRKRQFDIAEQNGFLNLKQINKETQWYKYLLDKLVKNEAGRLWNNAMWLTDWIVAWQVAVDPSSIALLVWKKVAESNRFRSNVVKVINKLSWHKNKWDLTLDLWRIQTIQSQKDLDNFLALPLKKNVTNPTLNTVNSIDGNKWAIGEWQITRFTPAKWWKYVAGDTTKEVWFVSPKNKLQSNSVIEKWVANKPWTTRVNPKSKIKKS